jgi:hypothetical protein
MRFLIFSAAVSAAVFMFAGAAHAQQTFDGTWNVDLITEQGNCNKTLRLPIVVQGGRPRYGGIEAGSVSANGSVTGTIASSAERADFKGRLSGERGAGTWSTSGSRVCSGRWNAEKRG